jgi:hypothetical protein
MVSQPYVDGITDTAAHRIASPLTADQIAATEDTVSISVVCPDCWFLGDFAVVTTRDGRAFAGEVQGMDVCIGEITIRRAGQLGTRATRLPRDRDKVGEAVPARRWLGLLKWWIWRRRALRSAIRPLSLQFIVTAWAARCSSADGYHAWCVPELSVKGDHQVADLPGERLARRREGKEIPCARAMRLVHVSCWHV